MQVFIACDKNKKLELPTAGVYRPAVIKSIMEKEGKTWEQLVKEGYTCRVYKLVNMHIHLGYAQHLVALAARHVSWYVENVLKVPDGALAARLCELIDLLNETCASVKVARESIGEEDTYNDAEVQSRNIKRRTKKGA